MGKWIDKTIKVLKLTCGILIIFLFGAMLLLYPYWNIKDITGGDKLNYIGTAYGSLIASAVTIIGIWLTLNQNKKQTQQMYNENQKNLLIDRSMGVYPYLQIVSDGWSSGNIRDILKYINHENYIIIDNGSTDVVLFQSVLCDINNDEELKNAFIDYDIEERLTIEIFKIMNSGVGIASNIFIRANCTYPDMGLDFLLDNETTQEEIKDGFHHSPLEPNKDIKIVICYKSTVENSYKFDFSYNDVYGNKFTNKFEFAKEKFLGAKPLDSGQQLIEVSSLYKEFKNKM